MQSTVEHHILVLLIGAAIGSFATVQIIGHFDAKTRAAVKAASTPAAVASVPKS